MDYINDYKRYTESKKRIAHSFVRPGYVVQFYYKDELKIGLVLNPNFRQKMHLVKLNEIPFDTFQRLIRPVIPSIGDEPNSDVAAQLLYRQLKPKIFNRDCYRVYSVRDIVNIEVLDLIKTTVKEEIVEEKQEAIAEKRIQFEKDDLTKDSL